MSVFVGIDGGGTRARAVAVDEHGRELARCTGPAGIVDARAPAAAAASAAALTRQVLDAAGRDGLASALCCGLAGAGREVERAAVRTALEQAGVAHTVRVTGDAEAAMADAFGDGAGVLVIAGTGSIAWAQSPGRPPVRVGGWGLLLGDEGSGYAIGLHAMRAVARAADGRTPPTQLCDVVLHATGVHDPPSLIPWVAAAAKAEIAALAPVVLQAAVDGDAAAINIRQRATRSLVRMARTAARRAGLRHPDVALAGGLIQPGGALREDVENALTTPPLRATILPHPIDAARGAARLARLAPTPTP